MELFDIFLMHIPHTNTIYFSLLTFFNVVLFLFRHFILNRLSSLILQLACEMMKNLIYCVSWSSGDFKTITIPRFYELKDMLRGSG